MSDEQIPLSDREMEILRLVATGASNQQIAQALTISVNTVKVHLRNIFAKLEVGSRTEATMVAVHQGWVDIPRQADELDQKDAEALPDPPPASDGALRARWSRTPVVWRAVFIATALAVLTLVFVPLLLGIVDKNGGGENGQGTAATASAASGSTAGRWLSRTQMPTPRTGLAVVEHGGLVYAIAGQGDKGVTGIVEVYDPQVDVWSQLEPKPTPVGFVTAVVMDGKIYVPGGLADGRQAQTVLEVYDPDRNLWSSAAALPEPLGAYGVATYDGFLYLFGGSNGTSFADASYRYDPASDHWESLAPLGRARGFLGAAALEDRIYVVGGYDDQSEYDDCNAYDPGTDSWSSCAPLASARGGLALVPVRESLYAIGGGMDGNLAFNERYDPGVDIWSQVGTPLTGEWQGLGATFVSPYIYAMGGWSEENLTTNEAYRALYIVVVP